MKRPTPNKPNETAAPASPVPARPSCAAPPPTSEPPSPVSGDEGFISKTELARRLHVSLRTIDYWRRRGIIPYIKCGHRPMFNWLDVLAHIESNFRVCCKQRQRRLLRIPVIGIASDGTRKGKPNDKS